MKTYINLQSTYQVNIAHALKKALATRASEEARSAIARVNTAEENLMHATSEAQEELFAANTIFPFVVFPDTISLDREKVTIIHRSFFRTADTISIQITDILNVQGNVGPFFGNLEISTRYFNNSTKSINYLRRKDVIKFQSLIQGSLIAHNKQIDSSNIEGEQLVTLLSDLGQSGKS